MMIQRQPPPLLFPQNMIHFLSPCAVISSARPRTVHTAEAATVGSEALSHPSALSYARRVPAVTHAGGPYV